MRNPFARPNYRDKFKAQIGSQIATIRGIEGFLRAVGIQKYSHVEIVIWSYWLFLMGVALSKAMDDKKQAAECIEELQAATPRIIEGLCSGVRASDGQMVVPKGFFPGDLQDYLRSFNELRQTRCDRYSEVFANPQHAEHERDDALGRAVDEMCRNTLDPTEVAKWDTFELFTAIRDTAAGTISHATNLLNS